MPSILIRNGTVVTMAGEQIIEDGAIFIQGARIVEVGPSSQIVSRHKADREIDATAKIVMPGLIDAHYHTCQQFLRSMLADIARRGQVRFPIWKNYFIPFESRLNEDDVYLSGIAAYTNMIRVGTTCISEHGGRHPHKMARAMEKVGIRGLLAESTMDMPDPELPRNMVFSTEEAMAKNVDLVRRWPGKGDDLVKGCFSLRQIIVCTPELFQDFTRLAERYDTMIQTHLAEGTYEIEYAIKKHNLRPAEYLKKIGALSPRLLAAHSVLLSDREVELYAEHGVKVAHCPSGNFTGLGMTKLPLMRRLGIAVGIGSDGASGGSIDLFQAMNISHIGQVLHYGTPYLDREATSPYDCLAMSTIGGAHAVGLDKEIGSLEPGKKADVIILDTADLDAQPMYDPIFTIVKCLRGKHVETVIVNGQLVMEKQRMLTVDEEEIRRQVVERAPQLYTIVSQFT
ncbi:MAG: amidohydrolase [Chloroflexi bacterium]|nr:amidohydrolase [Chloroflexota bacterium]MCL5075678.1 amidohydrolase [Chloroflexota bacterium]